ncbi:MAG: hypothetical protein R3B70_33950 [Polyangiaceae bacterium]
MNVNWCPALRHRRQRRSGRPLERGNHPYFRVPLRQWMMQITAYGDRLLGDLSTVDWPMAP